MSTLSAWNDQFEDLDVVTPDKKQSNRFAIQTGVCYPVLIRAACLCRSNFGDVQLMLDLDVKDGETGAILGSVKDWLSLPMQPQTDLAKERSKVLTLTRVRRNVLSGILAAVDPRTFIVGEPCTEENGDPYYLSWTDGHRMSHEEMEDRRIEVNRAVINYSKELHAMLEHSDNAPQLEGWAGTELFHVRKENAKNPKYPYSQYYRTPLLGVPMFTSSGAGENKADVPF